MAAAQSTDMVCKGRKRTRRAEVLRGPEGAYHPKPTHPRESEWFFQYIFLFPVWFQSLKSVSILNDKRWYELGHPWRLVQVSEVVGT